MHFEVLVEDESGKIALNTLISKILDCSKHTYKVISYKGIGRLPKDLRSKTDPQKRVLLNQLPKILAGYGKSLPAEVAAVVVVVDLDKRDCQDFKRELLAILDKCDPKPQTLFRIAIEEGEAWLLGDRKAVLAAYPKARTKVLDTYVQDAVAKTKEKTWEKLADAIYPGGAAVLAKRGYPEIGIRKCEWSEKIAPHVDVEQNKSNSFQVFRDGLRKLAGSSHE